jgi:chromate transporter
VTEPEPSAAVLDQPEPTANTSLGEIFRVFLGLGLTSFGGPVAHLGYFERDLVRKRGWLDAHSYAEIVALCQMLPGPASSQVGMAIGQRRGGPLGAIAAWAGFTAPSAIAMALFALLVDRVGNVADAGWLHGLKIVAVAIVAQAVWSMGTKLAPDRERATMAIGAAIALLLWSTVATQLLLIVAGGVAGWLLFGRGVGNLAVAETIRRPRGARYALLSLGLFGALLALLPALAGGRGGWALDLADLFYRAGALVFGGGHVVLPLLQAEIVPDWMSNDQFLAGYGAAQAVPGPLFTFSAYLGMVAHGTPGAIIAVVAIFLPSFLLIWGAMPFWDVIRQRAGLQGALRGVNAVVVGILLAALYDPIWTSAIHAPKDVALALAGFGLLTFWKAPSWLIVAIAVTAGAVFW